MTDHQRYEPPAKLPAHLANAARCSGDGCEAVLIAGFDPPDDGRCRNCAPKPKVRRPRETYR